MLSIEEVNRLLDKAESYIGTPYATPKRRDDGTYSKAGKPDLNDSLPMYFDCSGFTRWIIGQGRNKHGGRVVLPHGSYNQIIVCKPVATNPLPLDLGFSSSKKGGKINHVIINFRGANVIEARGHRKGKDYGKVIFRPRIKWENFAGFYGWFRIGGVRDNDESLVSYT